MRRLKGQLVYGDINIIMITAVSNLQPLWYAHKELALT